MGLDQYVYLADKKNVDVNEDLLITGLRSSANEQHEIAYWRKVYPIQNWMLGLYMSRGGSKDFNNEQVFLTLEDIERFQHDLENNLLQEADFTSYDTDDPYIRDSTVYRYSSCQEFVKKSKKSLSEGYVIFYDSSW